MRQFRVWCPAFTESEEDGAIYDTLYIDDALEQYMKDHTDSEDEAAAAGGNSWEVWVRRQGSNSKGEPFPALKYNMTGDYDFSWWGDVAEDCPQEDVEAAAAA